MSLISGLSKFYANSMSALRLIEYHWEKKCLVAFPTIFYANAVRPGFVFIEKLQNNDLMITSFAALRRPNNDIWRFQGWPVSILACFIRKNIWLMNIQCPWMIHCTNLKRFPQYLKCPRVNHFWWEFPPGLPSRGPASLWVTSSVSKWVDQGHSWKMFKRKQLFPWYDFP